MENCNGIGQKRREFRDSEKHQLIELTVGCKGSGKSALMKMERLKTIPRVIIFDHREEYSGCRCFSPTTLRELHNYIKKKRIYRIRLGETFRDELDDVMTYVYAVGKISLVIEEIPRIIPSSTERITGPIADIIYRGRHRCIDLYGITQRYSMININLRSQADVINVFRQSESTDIKTIYEKLDDEVFEKRDLRVLDTGDYLKIYCDGRAVEKKSVAALKKILDK